MTSSSDMEETAQEILECVASGKTPYECLQAITQRPGMNRVLLIHALISLGLDSGHAMKAVAAIHISEPDEMNRLVLEAIQTTDLVMSPDHHAKVQEKPL